MATTYVTSCLDNTLLTSFLPAMARGHMRVEILHLTKGVIFGLAPLHMTEKRPLLVRILAAGSSMLSHQLLNTILLPTVWTDEDLIRCRTLRTMGYSSVLSQPLFHGILPATLLASELGPLDAAFLMFP